MFKMHHTNYSIKKEELKATLKKDSIVIPPLEEFKLDQTNELIQMLERLRMSKHGR